jgi:hypothetical protein
VSWSGVLSTIDSHLVAAGLTLTPPVTAIRAGEPDAVTTPVFAYWYGGDRESTTGGNTLSKTNLQESVIIRGYFPGSLRVMSQDATLEVLLQSAKAAIRSRLWGDGYLGGNCITLDVGDTAAGWSVVGNAIVRTFEFVLWVDLPEVDTIAP